MERIQTAIEKARQQRQNTGGEARTAPRERAGAAQTSVNSAVAEAWLEVPEFVPSPGVLEAHRVVTYSHSPASAPFDMLRTKVLQMMRANNWRRVAITSPSKANGKTTIAANLAFGLARQGEIRVGCYELDLRRPALSGIIGLNDPSLEFSRVLTGTDSFPAHTRRVKTNLLFGPSHRPVSRSTELLQGDQVGNVLTDIERALDLSFSIFSMPPMLSSDDTLAFAGKVDCALLVAAAETTTIAEIDRCERELASQTNVLGVVLNKCRYMEAEYGYYEPE